MPHFPRDKFSRTHGLQMFITIERKYLKPVRVITHSSILDKKESEDDKEAVVCSVGEELRQEERHPPVVSAPF
jgi:hypothetical protein